MQREVKAVTMTELRTGLRQREDIQAAVLTTLPVTSQHYQPHKDWLWQVNTADVITIQ